MRLNASRISSMIVALVATASFLSGCGGGSGGGTGGVAPNLLAPVGGQVFKASVAASASQAVLKDPGGNATVTIPAGSMVVGAKVTLTEWSSQRAVAQKSGFTNSTRAVDITIDTSTMQSGALITVGLPWQAGADPIATMIVAFGATGNSTVLVETATSTPATPVASISASQIQFLTGAGSGPQTIEVAVEQQTPPANRAAVKPRLVKYWGRTAGHKAPSRTAYASKTRIAVVVPGIFSEDPGPVGLLLTQLQVAPLMNFLSRPLQTDGDPGALSYPFDLDEVWAYNYDFTQSIEANGAALANAVNGQADDGESWSDATKFEIHFIAHSMGGLVSRWALEKVGIPAAIQLITLGTPHEGVPLSVLGELSWFGVLLDMGTTLFSPGIRELVDDSDFIASLQASAPAKGVQYDMAAGSSHANLDGILGNIVNLIYAVVKPAAYNANDGIVPEYSALGGPGAQSAPQFVNHLDFVNNPASYWSKVASTWLYGINRKVMTLQISPTNPSVTVGSQLSLTVAALDKDGDKLDPKLISAAYTTEIGVVWTVDNSSVAIIDANTGVLKGVSSGNVNVTASTSPLVATTTNSPVSQTVSVTVTPAGSGGSGGGGSGGGGGGGTGGGGPAISSVTFSNVGQNMVITVNGSGFGTAPSAEGTGSGSGQSPVIIPYSGDCSNFAFGDNTAVFSAGCWFNGGNLNDLVTLNYVSWSDTKIVINGFSGDYGLSGQGFDWVVKSGDAVNIQVWTPSDQDLYWSGVLP